MSVAIRTREAGPTATLRRLGARIAPPLVMLAALVGTWQLVALHNPFLIPRIGAIWAVLSNNPREFVDAAGVTLQSTGIGLGASAVVAFMLAVAMSHSRLVERAVMPFAVVLNVTPVVALAPGFAVAFGLGSLLPRYLVTAIIVFFPLLVNSLIGLRSVDREMLDYFSTLNASRLEVLVHLRLPASLPFLFAAARICFPLAIIGAVVAEMTAGGTTNGLGSIIELTGTQGNGTIAPIYAAVACLSLLGIVVTSFVVALERRLLAWHSSQTSSR